MCYIIVIRKTNQTSTLNLTPINKPMKKIIISIMLSLTLTYSAFAAEAYKVSSRTNRDGSSTVIVEDVPVFSDTFGSPVVLDTTTSTESDTNKIPPEITEFAKEHPVLAIGAAIAIGIGYMLSGGE